jgi:biotin carboxylase
LGLPHNSIEAAHAARDKHRMRTLLARAGAPSPRSRLFSVADDARHIAARIDYPCVVKPRALNGSRGVMRADTPEEFVAAVERLARMLRTLDPHEGSTSYLVEDYIDGVEVALEGMLSQGRLKVLALFDKPDPLVGPFFEETIYVTPSRLPLADQDAIAACAAHAARALGLREGSLHAELRLNEQGPWIVEVAGRSIGGLCSQTLRFGAETNISLEEMILRQALDMPIDALQREGDARGVMMIPIPKPGSLKCVTGLDEARAVPGIESIEITAKLNYPILPLPEGDSYLGFIFARGKSADDVEAALRAAHQHLRFEIEESIALKLIQHM